MSLKQENREIQKTNQNDLRELEQFYTNNKVDTMLATIDKEKDKICNEIIEFSKKHNVPCKWNKEGDPIAFKVTMNPLVIQNYFFKPIIPITAQEPMYNAEKLGMVFDYYCYILSEVNDKIGNFPSSLTSFCKLAGITSGTLRSYKNSSDINMRNVVEKIYDQIGDTNLTMSQLGVVNERSTIFKLKSQNEVTEVVQPSVHININQEPDYDAINKKINKYLNFASKKGDK